MNAIRRFLQVQTLTRPLLQELIDHIDVFETEGVGKSRAQRVAVYYRFVGYIEIPELPKHRHNVKADTRQGVSVEYISCAPIKVRYGDDGEECEEGG